MPTLEQLFGHKVVLPSPQELKGSCHCEMYLADTHTNFSLNIPLLAGFYLYIGSDTSNAPHSQ